MKYRRKPIECDAVVWTGTNDAEVREFVGAAELFSGGAAGYLWTRDRRLVLLLNDAIVKDPDGGFSVVSAAVFGRDYEAIEETT